MSAPLLSALREPPVVGRFYLVPTVAYRWERIEAAWPVLGPLHRDVEYFGFAPAHYHLDIRFIGGRLARRLLDHLRIKLEVRDLAGEEERLAMIGSAWPIWSRGGEALPRPVLRRRLCRRSAIPTRMPSLAKGPVTAMAAAYGAPAEPIRTSDGRLLCPHRKVDLSQFARDAAGVVVCPLHGLSVKCGETA